MPERTKDVKKNQSFLCTLIHEMVKFNISKFFHTPKGLKFVVFKGKTLKGAY